MGARLIAGRTLPEVEIGSRPLAEFGLEVYISGQDLRAIRTRPAQVRSSDGEDPDHGF
ncbi:hypothetical protein [Oceaniradius stylonematis]|jgi:hypothetical protein|uniref:hypothetical protein n=1 Tax=Oceaniradius stylonematis TaxID=2184161 RepID=UPI00273F1B7A|nr:hypothetical protein [Oceaniradius stylonematis]